MQNIDSTYESWSKKRIIIFLFLIIILIAFAYKIKTSLLDKNINSFLGKVKGTNTKNEKVSQEEPNNSNVWKGDLQEKLDSVKKQASNLNVADIASSSAQVKKLIDDLQTLQQLPRNQVKEACYNICKGL